MSSRLRSLSNVLVAAALCLTSAGCQRKPAEAEVAQQAEGEVSAEKEIYAAWYNVPEDSLAKRRAGTEEFTAAHNLLPLGTRVRVTHLANGKSIVARITDRGITDRKITLDVCKEAALELDMVGEGIAKVRMEVLSDHEAKSR